MSTNSKGNITEAAVILSLLKCNYIVSKPVGNAERYDLIIDVNNKLHRVQCKTGQLIKGSVQFPVYSMCRITKQRKLYNGQIDYFAVYCAEINTCYLVPINICTKTTKRLRIQPTLNNQSKNITLASDFEIRLVNSAIEYPPV